MGTDEQQSLVDVELALRPKPFVPHRLLCWLVGVHGLAAWVFHLERYSGLTDHPLSATYAVSSLFIGLAGLVVVVWGTAYLWVAAQRLALRISPPPEASASRAARHITAHIGLTLAVGILVAIGAWVFPSVNLFTVVLGGLLTVSFGISGLTLIAIQHRNPDTLWLAADSSWPTARVLPPMAVATWTIYTLLELMALRTAGNFFNFVDITALVHVMFDEAITMFFGPGAVWFLTAIAVFSLSTAGLAVFMRWRSLRSPVHSAPGWSAKPPIFVLALAGVSLLVIEPRERLLASWYVHPQVASLTHLLSTPPTPTAADKEAAKALYPERVRSPESTAPRPLTADEYGRAATNTSSGQNVLVIFIDTLSRRHLEVYGHPRPVAPNIAALAKESLVFDRARSNGGHTDLATVALFYSLIPYLAESKQQAYATGHGGMPFHLVARSAGVKVGLFSGDWEVWNQGQSPVFPEHCDAFLDARLEQDGPRGDEVALWSGVPEHRVVKTFTDWYPKVLAGGDRFLAYVKLFRTHLPYYTPESEEVAGARWARPFGPQADSIGLTDYRPTGEQAKLVETRYDNAIHYADHHLGRLIEHLKASEAWENTSVVLIADHGEAWGEHGWYSHGHQHFEEFLEVPLLLRRPGQHAGRDGRAVSTIDVAPTVIDLLGLPPYPTFQGRSLLRSGPTDTPFWAFSNTLSRLVTYQVDRWKYTQDMVTGQTWLHDLQADPKEQTNLAWHTGHQARRGALRYLLYEGLKRQVSYAKTLLKHPTQSLIKPLPQR